MVDLKLLSYEAKQLINKPQNYKTTYIVADLFIYLFIYLFIEKITFPWKEMIFYVNIMSHLQVQRTRSRSSSKIFLMLAGHYPRDFGITQFIKFSHDLARSSQICNKRGFYYIMVWLKCN